MASEEQEQEFTSTIPQFRYTAELASEIEQRWQDQWETDGTYNAANPVGELGDAEVAKKPKLYVLDMFPYPSGKGLHVGHPLGFIGTDVYSRYHRMQGYNVLHTLGFDSFGLPAEQHAITTGVHPRKNTEDNIANMRRQLRRLGLGHDQRRGVSTTDEDFYKWTQWIFLEIFNSWFDSEANKAKPIAELEKLFESGKRKTSSGESWSELGDVTKKQEIDLHRLAYLSDSPVNWCPGLGTILANEEVTADGRSDIGNYPVFKRNMKQWMLRITAYADRLLDDLATLDWPDPIKTMQQNWIGKSVGASLKFKTDAGPLEVFTTRQDTIFGVSFLVISPEHPMVEALTTDENKTAVEEYQAEAAAKTDRDRSDDNKEKTGVFTGSTALNPLTGEEVPVWIADYVLMGYGTGAIMAVPCGDQRDFEFAKKYNLEIPVIQQPPAAWFEEQGIAETTDAALWPVAFKGNGAYINSVNDSLDLSEITEISVANKMVADWLEANDAGEATVTYRLRDWLFSRQRYWGEPFPILYDVNGNPHAVPKDMLPVTLPELEDFKPTAMEADDQVTDPVPPLARAHDWLEVELDIGDGLQTYTREVNVMPQWAGSCWYEMRYLDPTNTEAFIDPAIEKYWMGPSEDGHSGGADLYVGGVEHAVLHLLYSRFWHKVLFDLGHVSSFEPFHRLYNQGYIQAFAYRDDRGQPVDASDVKEVSEGVFEYEGKAVVQEYGKMGKSLKNIVTPDEMYENFGADTFRLYEMAMGPLDSSRPWNSRDVVGMQRFLQRVWRNIVDEETGEVLVEDVAADEKLTSLLHKTIAGVSQDLQNLRFNTAISKLIELNNAITANSGKATGDVIEPFVQMLASLAPHISEELWHRLGHSESVHLSKFPVADESLSKTESVTMIIQVNGKVRDRIEVSADISDDEAQTLALQTDAIKSRLDGDPKKVIVRAPNLVNVVI